MEPIDEKAYVGVSSALVRFLLGIYSARNQRISSRMRARVSSATLLDRFQNPARTGHPSIRHQKPLKMPTSAASTFRLGQLRALSAGRVACRRGGRQWGSRMHASPFGKLLFCERAGPSASREIVFHQRMAARVDRGECLPGEERKK